MTLTSPRPLNRAPLQFVRHGAIVTVNAVAPERSLLQLLRDDLRQCDSKEGCAAGDCGACTVVVAAPTDSADSSGVSLTYKAVNACLRLAHSVHGLALWTAGDLAAGETLHPVQRAMVDYHATQCGFCTPGFVMSLFALYQNRVRRGLKVDREQALHALSGNLCRCTGYQSIVQAACHMADYPMPSLDESAVLQALSRIAPRAALGVDYSLPQSLPALLQARSSAPKASLIAGATDAGLWVTQGLQSLPQVIDLTRALELQQIEHYPHHIAIGAAVNLQDAFDALSKERQTIDAFAQRFAGWPIRQSGTLGGNVANGSPIGDSMPLLIALKANVVLMAWRHQRMVSREFPLEQLYTGYRQNVMAQDEVLCWIKVPRPTSNEWLGLYKVSKRFEDDISAVCLAIQMSRDSADVITQISIGVGGVAATPVRAVQTQAALLGQVWDEARLKLAQHVLANEFSPISDMRASSAYRRQVLSNLLKRAYLESHGASQVRLEDIEVNLHAAWESQA